MWVTGAPGAATTNSSGVAASTVSGPQRPSAAGRLRQRRATLALARIRRDTIDLDARAFDRTVGRRAVDDAGDPAVQHNLRLRRDGDPLRRAADQEPVDHGEGLRACRRLAMIDLAEHNVGRALQRRALGRHVGRHVGTADETTIGLRIEVEAVAAQRQERYARRHFAFPDIELLQKRPAAVVFAAEQPVGRPDAVVGRAAERGGDDARRVGRDIAAGRIAAAGQRDNGDLRRPGLILHPVDESRQLAQLIVGRGPIGLRNRIDVARLRVGEADGEQPVPGVAVALEAPDRRLPDRGGVAVAVHEDDRNGGRLGQGGPGRRDESKRGGSLKHAAAVQHWAFFLHLRAPLASRGVYAELAPGQRPGLRNPMSPNRPTSPEHRLASKGASVAEAHLQHILR